MIQYKSDIIPTVEEIVEVYDSSGINRPTHDKARIQQMYANANLIVSAWDSEKLIGIARSLSDFCYCCYLSDLAVRKEYQKLGVGKMLIQQIKEILGEQVTLILLSAPTAMEYYPKIGFIKIENGFVINRKK
ncbi:MAG TPA: GNAT family N-acetyltransferase [Chitinophagales bacterium]|nr:GNAT family N-acetyltransferase [Chitinophagales bacterium]